VEAASLFIIIRGLEMKVLVCGSRSFRDADQIESLIRTFPKDTIIITGMAPGADIIAYRMALKHGLVPETYPAHWDIYGRAAGPIRNAQMIKEGKPDRVYAFYTDKERSKGTKNMVAQANAHEIPVFENI
jgi:hypothetical protein